MGFLRVLFLIFLPFLTHAWSAPPLVPGVYTYQGNHGTLSLTKDASGHMSFEIETTGANCHTCSLMGVVQGSEGVTEKVEADKDACRVTFTQETPQRITVTSNNDTCWGFCGARAAFDGVYQIPGAACTSKAQKKRRDQALASYRNKDYKDAESRLNDLLKDCSDFMDWIEKDEVRSEIALAQYHQAKPDACLKTLAETAAGDSTSQETLTLPPCDQESYLGTAKKIWFNKRLCEQGLKTRK